jgi:Raf kinase inhibitor-like YbhB/YbcL family protein
MKEVSSVQLRSDTLVDGARTPTDHVLAVAADPGPVTFSTNRNPHLAWTDVPAGTRSFVVTCIDHDCPSAPDDVNRTGREVPASLRRVDFTHWLLADVPASVREIPEGSHSDSVTPRGKPADAAPVGVHGVNDYTSWFAGDPDMEGVWCGYDGAAPPWNDSIPHRYEFTVTAIDIPSLGLDAGFSRDDLEAAMDGHVLASASLTVTHVTNPRIA